MLSVVLDAHNYLRTFYSVSANQEKGKATRMIASLASYFLRKANGGRVCAVFDAGEKTWRHSILPEFKSKRKPKDQALLDEIEHAKSVLSGDFYYESMVGARQVPHRIECYCSVGYEADDLAATICAEERALGRRVVIVSRDSDLDQLLEDGNVSRMIRADMVNGEWIFSYRTFSEFLKEHGFVPSLWADYQAIVGDSSDSFPGAKGLGDTAAAALVKKYGKLKNICESVSEIDLTPKKLVAIKEFDWARWLNFATLKNFARLDHVVSDSVGFVRDGEVVFDTQLASLKEEPPPF